MKLGIALGGGGARGGAHIGVLEKLLPLGLKPDLITGTSIGGLIGAMVCAGMSIEQIRDTLSKMKPGQMYALPNEEPAIASTERIRNLLNRAFSQHFGFDAAKRQVTFADLEIPLAVVATDLVTHREVVLDDGDLITALMATISVPIMFPPVPIGAKQLVDGGLVNTVPFDVARSRGATYTIAVDLSQAKPYGTRAEGDPPQSGERLLDIVISGRLFDRAVLEATRQPLWEVVTTVIDIVNNQNTRLNLAVSPPDLLIRPSMGTIGILDFHRLDEGIEAGRAAVERAAPEIERLLTQIADERKAAPTQD